MESSADNGFNSYAFLFLIKRNILLKYIYINYIIFTSCYYDFMYIKQWKNYKEISFNEVYYGKNFTLKFTSL